MRGVAWVLAVTAVVGAGLYLLLARRGRDDDRRLSADLGAAVDRGTFADLGRAQAIGRRLVLFDGRNREAAAALAFADAMLAVDYGAETAGEALHVLAGAGLAEGTAPDDGPGAMAAAARLLARLRGGDAAGTLKAAAVTAAGTPDVPYPLYALGRARARAGDLPGAARALEAAIVAAPGFTAARLAWAEARLDLGDPQGARAALAAVLEQAPTDPRALLLLDEVSAALDQPAPPALEAACRPVGRPPPFIAAACALARAGRARRAGDRKAARAQAEAAARLISDHPRLLGRTAVLLAQLGAVDQAAALLARARRLAAPQTPALAWAEAAVALGRGRTPTPPEGARPDDPEARLLVARMSLAGGGLAALQAALAALGSTAIQADADLKTLAALAAHKAGPDDADPLRSYAAGLQADLASDPARAAERLAHALSGHGDACRAAGEYVSALRALKVHPRAEVFAPLRAENAGCVNVERARPRK